MHISPRPIRPFAEDPPPDRRGRFVILAFILYALLAMAGTILLARHTGTVAQCADILPACGLP